MAPLNAPLKVIGKLCVPGDKSISHRALIISAIASGTSAVRGLLRSADVRSTEGALRMLGVEIDRTDDVVRVKGTTFELSGATLDCGNSGTTARLLAGVVAGSRVDATLIGDASLSRRPMRRVAAPLVKMGASVDVDSGGGLPMRVRGGTLGDLQWQNDVASAQVKSAVLLAACTGNVRVAYAEPALSRDHTERMLLARGAYLVRDGNRFTLERENALCSLDVHVPGDPSSAAFLAGFAAIAGESDLTLEGVCLNPTRIGAFLVLRRMGARIDFEKERDEGGEPVGNIRIRAGALTGTTIGADEMPALIDELPLLACVAACAEGETVITGATELRVKESDRIATVVAGLRGIGAEAEELPDGLRVQGGGRATALRGRVVTHGDHRIAMAFGILSALPGWDITIDAPACVDVSYPDFWRDVAHVRK